MLTALIHTRTFIVFVFVTIAYFFTLWQKQLSLRFQYLTFGFLLLILGVQIFFIQQSPALSPLVTGYIQRDLWALIFVLLLIPFAINAYLKFSFFLLSSLFLFILLLFFPLSFFNYGTQTLLDRPYVQMLAYIPFSILAGLGFAGLLQILQNRLAQKY
ncbi:MAG: hypothetical protein HC797_00770 [Anaerolineales bacterium]|nr:hypothetical protein [Anaerolineales bacterium]